MLEILKEMFRELSHVVAVFSVGPTAVVFTEFRIFCAENSVQTLHLKPFQPLETQQYASAHLPQSCVGDSHIDHELIDRSITDILHKISQGTPILLVRLCAVISQRHILLSPDEAEMQLLLCAPDMLPRFLCLGDIPLSAAARMLLHCACVFGRRFRPVAVHAVLASPMLDLATLYTEINKFVSRSVFAPCSALAAKRLDGSAAKRADGSNGSKTRIIIAGTPPAGATPIETEADLDNVVDEYMFVHSFVRDAIYSMIPPIVRRQLHLVVAHHLVREAHESADGHEPELRAIASHFRNGEDFPDAVKYFERAGDAAVAAGVYDEAVQCYMALNELCQAEEAANSAIAFDRLWCWRLASWNLKLGIAYQGLGEWDQACDAFAMAIDTCGYSFYPRWMPTTPILLALRLFRLRNVDRSIMKEQSEAAGKTVPARKLALMAGKTFSDICNFGAIAAEAMTRLAEIYLEVGAGEFALSCNYSALKIGVGVASPEVMVRILANMWMVSLFGEPNAAQRFMDLAVLRGTTPEISGNGVKPVMMYVLMAQAKLQLQSCRWTPAIDTLNEVILNCRTYAIPELEAQATWCLAFISFCQCKFQSALAQSTTCYELVLQNRSGSVNYLLPWCKRLQVHIYLRLDQTALAKECTPLAGDIFDALVQMHLGDFYMALDIARNLQLLLLETSTGKQSVVFNDYLIHLAQVQLLITVREKLVEKLDAHVSRQLSMAVFIAIKGLSNFAVAFKFADPAAKVYRALYLWQNGESTRAQRMMRQAGTAALQKGLSYQEGFIWLSLSRHAHSDLMRAQLKEALRIFRDLGVHPQLSQIVPSRRLSNQEVSGAPVSNAAGMVARNRRSSSVNLRSSKPMFLGTCNVPSLLLYLGGYHMRPTTIWGVCLEVRLGQSAGTTVSSFTEAVFTPLAQAIEAFHGEIFEVSAQHLFVIFTYKTRQSDEPSMRPQIVFESFVCLLKLAQILVWISFETRLCPLVGMDADAHGLPDRTGKPTCCMPGCSCTHDCSAATR
jgi:tetratricopeptide (TPR) repeat protein